MEPEQAAVQRGEGGDEGVAPRDVGALVRDHRAKRGPGPPFPAERQHHGRPEEAHRDRHRDAARLADPDGNGSEPAAGRPVDRPCAARQPPRAPQPEHESQQHRRQSGGVDGEGGRRPRPPACLRRPPACLRRPPACLRRPPACLRGPPAWGTPRRRRVARGAAFPTRRRQQRGSRRRRVPSGPQGGPRGDRRRDDVARSGRNRQADGRHEARQRRHQQHRDEHDGPRGVLRRAGPHPQDREGRRHERRDQRRPQRRLGQRFQHRPADSAHPQPAHDRPPRPAFALPRARRARRSSSSTDSTSSSTMPTRNCSVEPAQKRSMMRRTADAATPCGGNSAR